MNKSSVIFIINKNKEILLLKRIPTDLWMPNKWGLPGGGLNKNETFFTAVEREVKEETNLTIDGISWVHTLETERLEVRYFKTYFFSGDVKINEEHTAYRWIKPEDIIPEESTPHLKELALKFAAT